MTRAAIAKALAILDADIAADPEMQEMEREGTAIAPPEHTWVCGACGKTSRTKYGFDDAQKRTADPGWDESCMLNAVLCETSSLERGDRGRVINCRAVGAVEQASEEQKK